MPSRIEQLLETDHAEIDHLLARVFADLKVADRDEIYASLDLFWARLAMHIRAEHLRLFPALRRAHFDDRTGSGIDEMLQGLRADHDFFMVELARAIKALRLVFYFGNESETFEIIHEILSRVHDRLVQHNLVEEHKVYPFANEPYLNPEQIEEVLAGIRKELSNYPARFAKGESK